MKDRILKEVLEWYENQEEKPEVYIGDFVELVIDKTAEAIFKEIKNDLSDEFEKGNLMHPFVISGDYYLELKLKDIKDRCIKNSKDNMHPEEQEITT